MPCWSSAKWMNRKGCWWPPLTRGRQSQGGATCTVRSWTTFTAVWPACTQTLCLVLVPRWEGFCLHSRACSCALLTDLTLLDLLILLSFIVSGEWLGMETPTFGKGVEGGNLSLVCCLLVSRMMKQGSNALELVCMAVVGSQFTAMSGGHLMRIC